MGNSPSQSSAGQEEEEDDLLGSVHDVQSGAAQDQNTRNMFENNGRHPFHRADRVNYPDLNETLRYSPDGSRDSGPSIDTLANLYPAEFPLNQSLCPSSGSSHAEHEAWFESETARKAIQVKIQLHW